MTIKRAVIAFVIGVLGVVAPSIASASDMKTIAAATFKLYDASGDGFCSATFIKNDKDGALFLTAAHCVDDQKAISVRKQNVDPKQLRDVLSEEVVYLKAVKTLTKKDIAVLQAKDKSIEFSERSVDFASIDEANTLEIGNDLLIVGYPAAQAKAITKVQFTGKVPGIEAFDWDDPIYQVTGGVAGGNSGGGLYAQFGGEWKFIGTTSAMRRDNAIMSYFQTAETVAEALRGYGVGTTTVPAPIEPAKPSLRTDDR